ncbi:CxC4 domain-containing protein [Mycena sanguinolenta]|uniref:CxC4 domain-containing protein n=1 Tax=Mycena sanguinolenta TaxID=230812 RepID=A0A8H6YJA5_9AGAR|nr:CxC4 domain-containing protein [Mycena sanguinolenta]
MIFPYISLKTPPPSPGSHIQLGDTAPARHVFITPTRKRRQASRPKHQSKKGRQRSETIQIEEDEPTWDSAAEELLTGSDPTWNSPERPSNHDSGDVNSAGSHLLGYLEYCENVQEDGGAFYQIGADLFVVNGWDAQKKISKPSWFHVQRSTIGEARVVVCQCPLSRPSEQCVHQRFLSDYGEEFFPFDASFANRSDEAVLFSRQELEEGTFMNHFSSPSPNSRSLNGRVIVVHTGQDTGAGQWLCIKDSPSQACSHISKCRDLLQRLVRVDPSATDETVGDGSGVDYSGMY